MTYEDGVEEEHIIVVELNRNLLEISRVGLACCIGIKMHADDKI